MQCNKEYTGEKRPKRAKLVTIQGGDESMYGVVGMDPEQDSAGGIVEIGGDEDVNSGEDDSSGGDDSDDLDWIVDDNKVVDNDSSKSCDFIFCHLGFLYLLYLHKKIK